VKVTSVDDVALQTPSALVYGDSGIGKTTSLKTLTPAETIVAVSERGLVPLRGMNFLAVYQLETWEDIQELYGMLTSTDDETIKQCKWLAIDSLSGISDLCVQHILEVDRKALMKERTNGKRDTPSGIYKEQMTLEDWGLHHSRMGNLVAAFTSLPIYVIMTAMAAWSKDLAGGDTQRAPDFAGKFARVLPKYFDEVLYMTDRGTGDKPQRVWQTFHSGRIIARDASGKLDPYEETNWTKLYSKILNGGKS